MTRTLQFRKRQLVQNAIYDAAIVLFSKKGFEDTTVEEVAEAAGISRRSFFRYFQSKDHLLALNTVHCGGVLCETVASCPSRMSPFQVVRETVSAGLKFSESQKHTRQIIDIAVRSPAARQAHQSRMKETEEKLAAAFSARFTSSRGYIKPHLLAGLCQLIIGTSTASWYLGEHKDMASAAKHAFLIISGTFCEVPVGPQGGEVASTKKVSTPNAPKNSKKIRDRILH